MANWVIAGNCNRQRRAKRANADARSGEMQPRGKRSFVGGVPKRSLGTSERAKAHTKAQRGEMHPERSGASRGDFPSGAWERGNTATHPLANYLPAEM